MDNNFDNLVDQAYQDREPIEDRGSNEELIRIRKIEKELLFLERKDIQKNLLRLVNELNLTKRG
jgi:hypothetical protein